MAALQSRYEILSPEGLRTDGRRWNEMRRFSAKMATTTAADGSSYVEHGNTKVICSVNGPIEPRATGSRNSERATITVDVCFAAFSGTDRKKRGKGDKYFARPQITKLISLTKGGDTLLTD